MAYIPQDAGWFFAELIEEIRVEGAERNIVHINFVLLKAHSPEEAYARAIKQGERANTDHLNLEGKQVSIRFRGLRNLDVIHEPLEDGCEITFSEKLGLSEEDIQKLVSPKDRLEASLPIRDHPDRPDYLSGEVMRMLQRTIGVPSPDA